MEDPKQDKATQISNLVKRRDELETKIKDLNNTEENPYIHLSYFNVAIRIDESDRVVLLEKAMNDLKKVHEDISVLL